MAKFMHIWGEANFLLLLFGFGALIPSFDGTFMQPVWVSLLIIGATALSYGLRASLEALLESRNRRARTVSIFD